VLYVHASVKPIALALLLALLTGLTARGSDTFAFDAANRLTSATVAGVTTTTTYDGDGVRVGEQTGSAPALELVNDVDTGLPVVLDDGERRSVWGPTGLAYTVDGSAIEVAHADRLGSIRTLTDGSGSVVATGRTDEFGIPTAATGSTDAPYGYTGEPIDGSGLVHLRARHYDPTLGRFLTRDTWGGDPLTAQTLNRYSYVSNDPLTQRDPSGHCGVDVALDVGFIGLSVTMLVSGPEKDRGTNALALGADIVSLAIPCATGLGMLVRGGRAVDNVVDPGNPFALGIREHLDDFARLHGADTYKNLPDTENWKPGVLEKLSDPNQRVLFNLDGVDAWTGAQRSAAGGGGGTDWELLQVWQNDFPNLEFWLGGSQVGSPFR
jgi:RHS repeat-associated protein